MVARTKGFHEQQRIADEMFRHMSNGMEREECIAIVNICYDIFEDLIEERSQTMDRPDLRFMRAISANRQNR